MEPTARVSDVDDQIKQRVLTVGRLQGRIFEGDVPDGDLIPVSATGNVLPYATLIYGGAFRPGRRMRGIVSSRNDVKYHTVIVLVTASTINLANSVADDVRDALEGFEPIGASELYEESSGTARNPADSTLKPVRYTAQLLFYLLINP